ncbi:MAG: hypothetical protein KY453_00040 [Gemmatimonadetes bacterium]|nr:hypothetical protein [Gemmatimonadota bacterium]
MSGAWPTPDRAAAMAARVAWTLGSAGPAERRLVDDALGLAMEPRRDLDDHHPDHLHPGRSVLVLLLDTELRDVTALAAAALVESEREALRVEPEEVARRLGGEVAAAVAAIPPAGSPDLAETLVLAERPLRLVALAERLDQVRHAHLWEDPDRARRAWTEARDVYGPVAERTHPLLARRFGAWCRARRASLGA